MAFKITLAIWLGAIGAAIVLAGLVLPSFYKRASATFRRTLFIGGLAFGAMLIVAAGFLARSSTQDPREFRDFIVGRGKRAPAAAARRPAAAPAGPAVAPPGGARPAPGSEALRGAYLQFDPGFEPLPDGGARAFATLTNAGALASPYYKLASEFRLSDQKLGETDIDTAFYGLGNAIPAPVSPADDQGANRIQAGQFTRLHFRSGQLTAAEAQALREGRAVLYVFLTARYLDGASDYFFRAQLCGWYGADAPTLHPCQAHNVGKEMAEIAPPWLRLKPAQ